MSKANEAAEFNRLANGRYGRVLYNKNDLYVGKAIQKYGEYSEFEADLFKLICKEGDIVIDVGANIGTHTLVFSQLVGKLGTVYAFEPQRVVFQTLCGNMAINSIENVECHQMAASSEEGFTLIPDFRNDLEQNFGGLQINDCNCGIKVPLVKLDNFLDIQKLNFMKIDVEGMEQDVIRGAKKLIEKHKPALFIENDRKDKSKALIELLWSLDYRIYWYITPLFNPDNFAGCSENIFTDVVTVNMICFHKSVNQNLEGFSEVLDSDYHPLFET